MTVKDYFFYKTYAYRKKLKYKLRRVVDPSKKVPDVNCGVQDLLLEVVDLKREAPDLRSGGIRPNLTPGRVIPTKWRSYCDHTIPYHIRLIM